MGNECPMSVRSPFYLLRMENRGRSTKERPRRRTTVSNQPTHRPTDRGESLIVIMWPKTNLDTAAKCEQASEQAREQVSSADFRFNTANRNARRIC